MFWNVVLSQTRNVSGYKSDGGLFLGLFLSLLFLSCIEAKSRLQFMKRRKWTLSTIWCSQSQNSKNMYCLKSWAQFSFSVFELVLFLRVALTAVFFSVWKKMIQVNLRVSRLCSPSGMAFRSEKLLRTYVYKTFFLNRLISWGDLRHFSFYLFLVVGLFISLFVCLFCFWGRLSLCGLAGLELTM